MKEKKFFEKVKDTIEDALNLNDEPKHYRETLEGQNDTRSLDKKKVDISDFDVPKSDDIETIDDIEHNLPKASFDPDTLPIDDKVEDFISDKVTNQKAVKSEDIIPKSFKDTEPDTPRFNNPNLDKEMGPVDDNIGMSPSKPMEESARKFDDERFDHSDLTGENPNLNEAGTVYDDEPVHTLNKNMERTFMDDPVAMNEDFVHDPVNSPNRALKEEPEYMDADTALNIENDENMQDSSAEASFEDELPSDDGVNY